MHVKMHSIPINNDDIDNMIKMMICDTYDNDDDDVDI